MARIANALNNITGIVSGFDSHRPLHKPRWINWLYPAELPESDAKMDRFGLKLDRTEVNWTSRSRGCPEAERRITLFHGRKTGREHNCLGSRFGVPKKGTRAGTSYSTDRPHLSDLAARIFAASCVLATEYIFISLKAFGSAELLNSGGRKREERQSHANLTPTKSAANYPQKGLEKHRNVTW
jgi:hypothetical protein